MSRNALQYPIHKKARPGTETAKEQGMAMRNAHLTYKQAERVLWGQNLKLDLKLTIIWQDLGL
jgi:hypothetical protein